MKLRRFTANNVRGYMNFDIEFRDGVTFLIGINGSGKTTVLKLLSGLLTPSYVELSQIEFSEIHLSCETLIEQNQIEIICTKEDDNITLEYIDSKNKKTIADKIHVMNQQLNRRRYERDIIDSDQLSYMLMDFEKREVVQKIKDIKTSIFLGLNRRITEANKKNMNFINEDTILRRRFDLDLQFDSVDNALNDIQEMIFDLIRTNARRQGDYSEDFRKKVLQESFRFGQFPNSPVFTDHYTKEAFKLDERKESLVKAISSLGIKELSEQIESYFSELSSILEELSNTASTDGGKPSPQYYETLIKWMINCSQLERIDKIIEYGNKYEENISKLNEPIMRLKESVNLFFKEGNKEIIINGRGDIKIIGPEKKINTIFELSSGEKQLIIMLAHLSFCIQNKKTAIFIIDEPELSLHISWQEIFVDALLKASPKTQFIMATHSPSILAKTERKGWCEDLTNGN